MNFERQFHVIILESMIMLTKNLVFPQINEPSPLLKDNADSCTSEPWKQNSSIILDCPGKKLVSDENITFEQCCEAVETDSECGRSWFFDQSSGSCICEDQHHDCIRVDGTYYSEYRKKSFFPSHVIHPDEIRNLTNETTSEYFQDFKIKEYADCLMQNGNTTLNEFRSLEKAIDECFKASCWGITHFFGLNHGNHSEKYFLVCRPNAMVYVSSHSYLFYDHIKLNKAQNLSALDVRGDHLCSDGSYLPASHWKCDGSKDCLDGTDEQNCTNCCLELNIEVDIIDDNGNNSKEYLKLNGAYERLTYKHNGKVQYQHIDQPEILLHFHSSWTKGSLWAISIGGFWKECSKFYMEEIDFHSECFDGLTQERNSKSNAYFKINERENNELLLCEGDANYSISCVPKDGEWGEWNQWSNCNVSCGGGIAKRNKSCIYQDPLYPGKNCSAPYSIAYNEEDVCNNISCSKNCLFGEWNPWTVCDPETAIKHQGYRLCGIGGKEQTRDFQEIAISNGTSCADESRKYTECQLEKEETNCSSVASRLEVRSNRIFTKDMVLIQVSAIWLTFWIVAFMIFEKLIEQLEY